MPHADDLRTPSTSDAARLHTYLASFLSPAAADEVADEAIAAAEGGNTAVVLGAAHRLLRVRVEVPRDIEVAVLVEDLGLPLDDVATILDLPVQTVRTICDVEGIEVAAPPAAPAAHAPDAEPAPEPQPEPEPEPQPQPEPTWPAAEPVVASAEVEVSDTADVDVVEAGEVPPLFDDEVRRRSGAPTPARERPRNRAALFAALGVVAVGVLAFALGARDTTPGECEPTPTSPVCVADVRVTDVIDASGSPGADRTRFELGETVKVWFAFERLDERERYEVDYVWYRGDQPLYASSFELPVVDRVNLSLASAFASEPGTYRVQIRNGDDVLLDEAFTIG